MLVSEESLTTVLIDLPDAKTQADNGDDGNIVVHHDDNADKNGFTFIDLFSGIGGFRIACESVGGTCVWSNDIDKYACMTYKSNFGDDPIGDITKTDASDVPHMDVICGGFPCQAFSISGKRLGFDDKTRGTLFFDVLRLVKYHKPKLVFLENVRNLLQHDHGRTFEVIRGALTDAGYTVAHALLRSSDYGVPQIRQRVYIIAIRDDIASMMDSSFTFPEKQNGDKGMVCLEDVLDTKNADVLMDRYGIDMGRVTFTMTEDDRDSVSRCRDAVQIGYVGHNRQGERVYLPKGSAITLSAYGGGIGAKTGLYLIGDGVRKLSPAECLRVQGFPDWYRFPDGITDSQRWKQTGNSVSVPVLTAIMREVMKQVPLSA